MLQVIRDEFFDVVKNPTKVVGGLYDEDGNRETTNDIQKWIFE
jgi:hypothetical protein